VSLTLCTFNVLDLFDARFTAKIDEIARMLAAADADVVALQEVGSRDALEAVRSRLSGYLPPIFGTADPRGIGNAILSRRPVLASGVHTAASLPFPAFAAGDPEPFGERIQLRRGVVHARIDAGDLGHVEVLVAHLKSNRPRPLRDAADAPIEPCSNRERAEAHLRSLVWRSAEALHVRGLVDALFAREPDARVAVMGDFNDVPGSLVLKIIASSDLACPGERVPAERRFSALHAGKASQIDHVLLSAPLASRIAAARFLNDALRDHGPYQEESRPSVDSDHAPFVVELR
jgi:endonuclease/exonuclease/phosphatase family metal-dependent hydrolase